jgi:hypothetical protein
MRGVHQRNRTDRRPAFLISVFGSLRRASVGEAQKVGTRKRALATDVHLHRSAEGTTVHLRAGLPRSRLNRIDVSALPTVNRPVTVEPEGRNSQAGIPGSAGCEADTSAPIAAIIPG